MSLRVHIACGGTGGHIFPGLATAEVLVERGHEVTLWLAGKDVEAAATAGWRGPVMTVAAEGYPSGWLGWKSVRSSWLLLRAIWRCRGYLRARPPNAMLAMGSYACVGPSWAARGLGVPLVIHEANVIPGRAIAWLARRANVVAASFEETRFHLRRVDLHVTGMPLRREIVNRAAAAAATPARNGRFTVLVTGGSRGAHRLNETMVEAVRQLRAAARRLRILHLTGPADEAFVRAAYDSLGVEHDARAFTLDIHDWYARADLAICRAGAATCAELALFAVPALLVPYPHAVRNHQLANARALARHGGADVVEERDLDCGWLAEYLAGMAAAPDRRERMRAALRRDARADAAERLADLVEKAARHGRARDG